jgi:hypothetical protein
MGRTDVLAALQRIERMHPVFKLHLEGVPIWPLIRIYLGMRALAGEGQELSHNPKPDRMQAAGVLRGLGQLTRLGKGPEQADLLFLTNRTYQALEDGHTVDKFAHPLMESAAALGYRSVLVNTGPEPAFPWRVGSRFWVRSVHDVRQLRSAFFWRTHHFHSTASLIPADLYRNLTGMFSEKVVDGLEAAFQDLRFLSRFYASLIDRCRPRHVFVTCWYSLDNMAILNACHARGIPTTDLQHGVQGPAHLAYADWPGIPATGCSVMPTNFWCWDNASASHLNSWLPHPAHRAVHAGSPWLERTMNAAPAVRREHVLFTLQPIVGAIPDGLERVILQNENTFWTFRLHPNALHMAASVHEWAKRHGIEGRSATQLPHETPIASALSRTMVHVTLFSSVIREAAMVNVPSIALDPGAGAMYPDLVSSHMLTCVTDLSCLASSIEAHFQRPPTERDTSLPSLEDRLALFIK